MEDDFRDEEEKKGLGEKILNLLGWEYTDEDEDLDDDDFEQVQSKNRKKEVDTRKRKRKGEIVKEAEGSSGEIVIVEPTRKSDARIISDELKSGRTVVVHVRTMDLDDTTRLYDFITGAAYALEGKVQQVSDNVIVLAPRNIDISTNESADEESGDDYGSDELDYGLNN
ncbi:MAG: cell division protein SepF [Eubacteriaceae bacterium]|nr:cell division protein SepF [Eubacteriaceae bacterium]